MTQRNDPPADLVTVEADLAEHIIDLLAAADIPALDRPAGELLTTVLVRSSDVERARGTLDLVLPGLLAEEAGELLEDTPGSGLSARLVRRTDWPESEPPAVSPRPGGGLVDGRAAFADALDEDGSAAGGMLADDGDFVPPPPPPLPRGDVVSRFAWLGAVGGPVLIVVALLAGLPAIVAGAGLAAFVAGFGVLVARLPDRPRQDDGWDDGAVL